MIISIIAALDQRNAIGQNNRIPWRQSADLQRFAKLTTGHYVVMGRRTYESLPMPRNLVGRKMIVLSSNEEAVKDFPSHVIHHRSIFSAIEYAEQAGEDELFLIGGWEVYMMGLMFADRLYLTRISTMTPGKVTKFPDIAWPEWEQRQSVGPYHADEKNQHGYTFETYERITEDMIAAKKHAKRLQQFAAHRERTMTDVICAQCGTTFQRALGDVKSSIKHNRLIFCSMTCSGKSNMASRTAKSRISCTCDNCGVQFDRPASLARNRYHYCSRVCYYADLKRVRNL